MYIKFFFEKYEETKTTEFKPQKKSMVNNDDDDDDN